MMGQEHVLKALSNALESERLHHAYLFTGTRGVGKTTVARVLAKALNCEQGITASPCGECASCQEIDEGRFVDLIEVDAASRTKVEDTRELLDNVQYAPTRGRFKIYLIDEVHMLSGHSFNALLKTLEEPPPHVKFLLATTDPQKLPVTILSRCLQFNLKSLSIEQIETQLAFILNAENIPFENTVLKPLAIAADGSMRDALSLMDQSIAYSDGKPNLADIEAMLGCVQKDRVFELLTALANEDGRALIQQSRLLIGQGIDVKTILSELINTMQRIALGQMVPDAIDDSLGDKSAIQRLARLILPEDIQLYYQIALNGRKDLPYSPQPQGGFEMILLRMLAFKPVNGGNRYTTSSEPVASMKGGNQRDKSHQQGTSPQQNSQEHQRATTQQASVQSTKNISSHFDNAQSVEKKTVQLASEETIEKKHLDKNLVDSPESEQVSASTNHFDASPVDYNPDESNGYNEELPPIDAYGAENFNDSSNPSAFKTDDKTNSPLNNEHLTDISAENHSSSTMSHMTPVPSQNSRPANSSKHINRQEFQAHSQGNAVKTAFDEEPSANKEPSASKKSSASKKPLTNNETFSGSQNSTSSLAQVVPLFKSTNKQEDIPCNQFEGNELADYWHELINGSELKGLEQQLAKHCELVNKYEQENSQVFELLLDSAHKHLLNDKIKDRLVHVLQNLLNCSFKLDIKECQVRPEEQLNTPRRREIHEAKVLQEQAVKSIYSDPKVQMIVNSFSAKVREETIKPIKIISIEENI